MQALEAEEEESPTRRSWLRKLLQQLPWQLPYQLQVLQQSLPFQTPPPSLQPPGRRARKPSHLSFRNPPLPCKRLQARARRSLEGGLLTRPPAMARQARGRGRKWVTRQLMGRLSWRMWPNWQVSCSQLVARCQQCKSTPRCHSSVYIAQCQTANAIQHKKASACSFAL